MSVLSAQGVGVSVAGTALLRDVELDIGRGELVALVGPNGAGKSTLLRTLAGLLPLSAGSIALSGTPLQSVGSRALARTLAFVAQDHSALDLTVEDLVLLGRYAHRPRFARTSTVDRDAARAAVRLVGLDHLADRAVASLSGGERQLAHIARALAQSAPVLLLDEPTAALDVRHQLTVMTLLRSLADDGCSVVVVLHDLDQAARFCDRIAVVHHGAVCAAGAPEAVLTPERIADVYGVDALVRRDPRLGTLHIVPLHLVTSPTVPTPSGTTPPPE